MKSVTRLWLLVALFFLSTLSQGAPLEVHFEERHSGAFFHFAENLDLESSCVLLLIDAHSDASCVAGSDQIRSAIRQVTSVAHRRERLDDWRKRGRVQVYDWIEPLMPNPLSRVVWIGGDDQMEEAREQIDRLASLRQCQSLRDSWTTSPRKGFAQKLEGEDAVIASLDLDYFAGWPREKAREGLLKLWEELMTMKNLKGVNVALSRPWLRDEREARFLTDEIFRHILTSRNIRLRFEPFPPLGPDRSEEARRRLLRGERQPTFDFTSVSDKTKDLILREQARISVSYQSQRWDNLLDLWERKRGGWWLKVDNHQAGIDERVRIKKGPLPTIRVRNREGLAVQKVTWFAENAEKASYNVMPEVALGKEFADAGQWLGWDSQMIATTPEGALAGQEWSRALIGSQGWGVLRVWAEVETTQGAFRTPPLELRVYEGEGFRAGLTEQFGLPYIFGVGRLWSDGFSGPELGWGNDCANLLVWAWQRDGFPLPWCNPGQLRGFLEPMGTFEEGIEFSPLELARGIVLDRGTHVSALWEDREPKGILDKGDLLIHQLGGRPEVISVEKFLKDGQQVQVRKRPALASSKELVFAGDVNLDGVEIEEALEKIEKTSGTSKLVANLECVLSSEDEQPGGRYRFSAHVGWAQSLAKKRVLGFSLANNHALDCGEAGLKETRRVLLEAGIQVTGGGSTLEEALSPIRHHGEASEVAILAVNCVNVETMALQQGRAGVLCLPQHQESLRKAIRAERVAGREVVVMVHWGQEFTVQISEEQRKWGRWLVEAGATRVIGSHPHVRQMSDYWRGHRIDFSLGDLVFPGR